MSKHVQATATKKHKQKDTKYNQACTLVRQEKIGHLFLVLSHYSTILARGNKRSHSVKKGSQARANTSKRKQHEQTQAKKSHQAHFFRQEKMGHFFLVPIILFLARSNQQNKTKTFPCTRNRTLVNYRSLTSSIGVTVDWVALVLVP